MSESRSVAKTLTRLGLLAVVLAAAVTVWLWANPALERAGGGPGVAVMSEDEFGRRVRDYLVNNPEVVVDAVRVLRERQAAALASEAIVALTDRADAILRDPDSPVGGNPDGDVSLVEFFDYNCPYCRRVAPVVQQAVAADGGLRIVYKELPILGPGSDSAAKAALASRRQGRYVDFHNALMDANRPLDDDLVMAIAGDLGLDLEALARDMRDPAIAAAIERNKALARTLRITGTPGFVVGETVIRGATDLATLRTAIAKARERRETVN